MPAANDNDVEDPKETLLAGPQAPERRRMRELTRIGAPLAVFLILGIYLLAFARNAVSRVTFVEGSRRVSAATWNMAAINNNPFEYWITYEGEGSEAYGSLMDSISDFLSKPGNKDVVVSTIFTDDMFDTLLDKLPFDGLEEVREYWKDLKKRTIVEGVLKDASLGAKRLMSMPDRVTNTIRLVDGTSAMRPTVINCYGDDLSSLEIWWKHWQTFMFDTPLKVDDDEARPPVQMLVPIRRSKYPEVTEQEEQMSRPLSAACLAVFDAILVHIVNQVSDSWGDVRKAMCLALNSRKNDRSADILETDLYNGMDVVFLQESSMTFKDLAESRALGQTYFDVHSPTPFDPDRDQNSLILTKKGVWGDVADVTSDVLDALADRDSVALGDVCAVTATRDDRTYLLASFHGDTNGVATNGVVDAVRSVYHGLGPGASLFFGLDANTHFDCRTPEKLACVGKFARHFTNLGMDSCYGHSTNPADYAYTTFNARTYLQPQLNKAVKASDKFTSPMVDKNPKDFILFDASDFQVDAEAPVLKDNTGNGEFIKDIVFPTLDFPSDHAITRAHFIAGEP